MNWGTLMIQIKTDDEVGIMRESAKLAAEVLLMIEPYVKPGVTTNRLNDLCHDFIISMEFQPNENCVMVILLILI